MDNHMRGVIKFLLVAMVVLTFSAATFFAGFGSAYLLTDSGVLPARSASIPSATPSPPPEEENPSNPDPLPTTASEDEEIFQLFWEVWDLIERNFYGELPDMQQVTYAAIRGMLNTLNDDYTAFIEPDIAAIIAEDATGEFEGIGAWVGMDEDGKLEIVGTFEESPAEQAGLLEGDRVLEVDGVSIVGSTVYEAISLIRGPAGSEVTLLVEREGVPEPFEVTVTRARQEIPLVDVEMREEDIGYIRLYEFSAPATERMEDGLEELLSEGAQGIVLDLRDNPGGWLDQSVGVADLFLDDGVVVIERWSDGREEVLEAGPGDVGEDIPLVVLVNGGSASASEIVAGALQDHERAMLVGEPTYGKGSVQRPFTLSDGSELRVTSALWFTPDNHAIHGQGLTPDIEVPWPEEETEEMVSLDTDPQLERAVDYLLSGE